MRTREEQIKPWGYISPFATETLQDRARCDLTITRKQTHNITMPLYTDEQLREAERRAEQRVRAQIGMDSERLDWLEKARSVVLEDADNGWRVTIGGIEFSLREETARNAIDAARETE